MVLDADSSDINRFNRHYRGLAGAAISAALVILHDRDELTDPGVDTPWYDEVLCPLCEGLGNDPSGQIRLADRIWDREGWR
jgi:hypothetical protein